MQPKTLARKIAALAFTKKAHDVIIIDLRKLTDMTDYFVICSGDSDTQVKAVADAIVEGTDKLGQKPWHSEGVSQRQWILLDFVDVVAHVFTKEVRRFYGLEKLWGDATIERVADTSPSNRSKAAKAPPRKARMKSS